MKTKSTRTTPPDLIVPCATPGLAFGPGKSFAYWLDALPKTLTQMAKVAKQKRDAAV